MTKDFQYINSKRGGKLVLYQNYLYRVSRKINNVSYFQCNTKGCKTSLKIIKDEISDHKGNHQHPPNLEKQLKLSFYNKCKEKCLTDLTASVTKIYRETIAKHGASNETALYLPSIKTARKCLHRARASIKPPTLLKIEEINVRNKRSETGHEEQVFLTDETSGTKGFRETIATYGVSNETASCLPSTEAARKCLARARASILPSTSLKIEEIGVGDHRSETGHEEQVLTDETSGTKGFRQKELEESSGVSTSESISKDTTSKHEETGECVLPDINTNCSGVHDESLVTSTVSNSKIVIKQEIIETEPESNLSFEPPFASDKRIPNAISPNSSRTIVPVILNQSNAFDTNQCDGWNRGESFICNPGNLEGTEHLGGIGGQFEELTEAPTEPINVTSGSSGDEPSQKEPTRSRDEFDAFADFVALKLRRLDLKSCAFVQKAISDLLFEAEMGKFSGEGEKSVSAKKTNDSLQKLSPSNESQISQPEKVLTNSSAKLAPPELINNSRLQNPIHGLTQFVSNIENPSPRQPQFIQSAVTEPYRPNLYYPNMMGMVPQFSSGLRPNVYCPSMPVVAPQFASNLNFRPPEPGQVIQGPICYTSQYGQILPSLDFKSVPNRFQSNNQTTGIGPPESCQNTQTLYQGPRAQNTAHGGT